MIRYDAGRLGIFGVFVLHQADGERIASCAHPGPLVQYAWANGVIGVRHDYDLKIVEDMEAKARGSTK